MNTSASDHPRTSIGAEESRFSLVFDMAQPAYGFILDRSTRDASILVDNALVAGVAPLSPDRWIC